MKRIRAILLICLVPLFLDSGDAFSDIVNRDSPARGDWDFRMKPVWTIDGTGGQPFASLAAVTVSDSGLITVHDRKRARFHLLDSSGKLIKSFGKAGEGPGEIKNIRTGARPFAVADQIIIFGAGRVHYFSRSGEYLRSLNCNLSIDEHTVHFIDKNQILFAPTGLAGQAGDRVHVSRMDLLTKKTTVLAELKFSRSEIFVPGRKRIRIAGSPGLMPGLILGYNGDRFYYGINHTYRIHIGHLAEAEKLSFKLERRKRQISIGEKRRQFKGIKMPPPVFELFLKSVPDFALCFNQIAAIHNLIYVFVGEANNSRILRPRIDIFSMDGRYIYRCILDFGSGNEVIFPISTLQIKDRFLYAALEDEEGDIHLAKYELALPGDND